MMELTELPFQNRKSIYDYDQSVRVPFRRIVAQHCKLYLIQKQNDTLEFKCSFQGSERIMSESTYRMIERP
jgi:hypothetical protein